MLHVFCRPVGMLAEVSISSTTSAQERIVRNSSVRLLPKFAKKHLESAGISIRFRVVKDAGDALVKQIVRSQPNRLTESNII